MSDIPDSGAAAAVAVETGLSGLYMAYCALLVMALVPIYVGSHLSLDPVKEEGKGQGQGQEQEKEKEKERISRSDAQWFPVYGSMMLFSLYLLFKFVSAYYVNLILSLYFSLLGIASLVSVLYPPLSPLLFSLRPRDPSYRLLFSRGDNGLLLLSFSLIHSLFLSLSLSFSHSLSLDLAVYIDLTFDWAHVVLAVVSTGVSIYYAVTKNWILNNVFGEAFSLGAIQLLHLDSFTTGFILLSGLFFYDIFWVFGTEVMVSVAKAFDAPIKVVFPKDLFADTLQFSMLGLGDIVIPGIFVALALRFDQSRAKGKRSFPKPYFTACFAAYCLGLLTTIVVMQTFKAAQVRWTSPTSHSSLNWISPFLFPCFHFFLFLFLLLLLLFSFSFLVACSPVSESGLHSLRSYHRRSSRRAQGSLCLRSRRD